MANVKISQLPIGTPTSSSIFPFVENSTTYQGYISALTTADLVEVTLSEFNNLVVTDEVLPGKSYLISEVDSDLYGGTSILVQGITSNSTSNEGYGIFYNPKYDQSINDKGIWNRYIELSILNYTGTTFTIGETVTSDSGAIATFLGGEFFEWVNGAWSGDTFITGNTSGTIAEVTNSYFQEYNVGDKVIWGGKVWELTTSLILGEEIALGDSGTTYSGYTTNTPITPSSITIYSENDLFYDDGLGVLVGGGGGNINYDTGEWSITTSTGVTSGYSITMDYTTSYVGNSLDKYDLSSIWSAVTYNSTDYDVVVDSIEYDYVHDKIIYRKDRFGNKVNCTYESISYFENLYGNPIKDFQWGNGQDNWGIGPSLYYFNDVSLSSDDIQNGGDYVYDNGNTLNSELGQIPYTHTQMTEPPVNPFEESPLPYFSINGTVNSGDLYFGSGSLYFTSLYPGLFVMEAVGTSIDTFYIDGGVGADCSSELDSYTSTYTNNGDVFTAFVKRYFNYSTPKPSINHIIIVNGEASGVTHDYTSGGCDSDFDEITGLLSGGVNTIYYLTLSLYPDEKISDAQIDSIVDAFLNLVNGQTPQNAILNLNDYHGNITGILPSNQTSAQLGVMNNTIDFSYFECLNFMGGHLWNNELKNYSVFSNNLFSPNNDSFFSDNFLTNSSEISNNLFTESSSVTEYNLNNSNLTNNNFFSYLTIPSFLISSELVNSNISGNTFYTSILSDNKILNNSNINLNEFFDCLISGNTLSMNCEINNNQLVNSTVSLNKLSQSSSISSNVLSDGIISNNKLEFNSFVNNNSILTTSSIIFNSFTNNSLLSATSFNSNTALQYNNFDLESSLINGLFSSSTFEYNYLKNTYVDLTSSCIIDSKTITNVNFVDSVVYDISENSTVIFDSFSKNVFTNSSGITRISYYDGTDTLIIGNINDSILPTLNITGWTAISSYNLDVYVNVTLDGGNSVTERGSVWGLSPYPTVADNLVVDAGTGTGSYTSSLTGLTSGSTIYFRGYAVNSIGTGYTCQDTYDTP